MRILIEGATVIVDPVAGKVAEGATVAVEESEIVAGTGQRSELTVCRCRACRRERGASPTRLD